MNIPPRLPRGCINTTGTHAIYITHQINPDPHDDGSDNVYKQVLAAFLKEHRGSTGD